MGDQPERSDFERVGREKKSTSLYDLVDQSESKNFEGAGKSELNCVLWVSREVPSFSGGRAPIVYFHEVPA